MVETPTTRCLSFIGTATNIISGKWSFLVLSQLYTGSKRFNQLQRALNNISSKALTNSLRQLESAGMVQRQVYPTVPVTVVYSLTDKGIDFQYVLREMNNWGERWLSEEE
ncbi:winged helix-turn-helix transcriptional regulator [Thermoflavimicrobium daqui]|uniref:Transcriptional regulator n=1 Tax=Thermoflavimicrobium daqui TaxID=2137476 RepID=A0A364K475_9BACL|nr:helix-turn-helix domain-containing protein [Thermoflavimicrobium daqui]RAL24170.1 transcriptional regulator [Thermoflavimicrobium daqui]